MKFVKLILCLIILSFCGNVFGQSSAELTRQRDALTRQIEQLTQSLERTSTNKRLSQRQINEINAKIRLRQQKINVMSSQIKLLNNEISDNTNTITSLQTQLNKLKKEYAGMVLFAFRNQSSYSKLMFVFASQNFNQAYKRLKYLQQFTEYRKKQAKYIQETQRDLGAKIVELDQNKKEKNDVLRAQENEKRIQLKAKADQTKVLSNLTNQEKQYQQERAQKQKDLANLNRLINAAITRATSSSSRLAATPESAKLSADFLDNRGRLPWPVAEGTIVEGFGPHTYGVNVKRDNKGIDIKTNEGASVRAIFSGEVSNIIPTGATKFVLIKHGEYYTVYTNLRSVSVSKGQKVSVKQAIGIVATDPSDGTTQVQLQIRNGSTPMNPETWLAR